MTGFALGSGLDPAALGQAFIRGQRLQIADFLRHDGAVALLRELSESRAWTLTVNQGEEVLDFPVAEMERWDAERRADLDARVEQDGRTGFQFRYDTIRARGERAAGLAGPALTVFLDFLNSPEILAFMRNVTGCSDIAFADGHATRYRTGHFLTAHDDRNDPMQRRVAYVMNLTPQWRPDWGGLLQFLDERGNVAAGYTPGFNIMNLFRVPQPHAVSWVTPLAAGPRHSVTGWFRAGAPPSI
jgi:hypothetical protein